MPMIFPGMDPYLEQPQLWPSVHNRLVVYLADQLQPLLRPHYVATIEERVYVEGPDRRVGPDLWIRQARPSSPESRTTIAEIDEAVIVQVPGAEVRESYIEILDLQSGQRVVTVIEVLSPANKHPGPGRESYLAKQREILGSRSHLVEIDLLRAGEHSLSVPEWMARNQGAYDYLVCINRAGDLRSQYELYPRRVRQRLPRIGVPVVDADPDVPLDLQAAVEHLYEAGAYRDRIDYHRPCVPPLSPDDQAWADELIEKATRDAGPIEPSQETSP